MDRQCEQSFLASNGKASIEGNAQTTYRLSDRSECWLAIRIGFWVGNPIFLNWMEKATTELISDDAFTRSSA
jgi:hypothetical protein